MRWKEAPDIKKEIRSLIGKLRLSYLDPKRIICFRSFGSRSKARARIWGFPRVWQKALKLEPHYVIEVLSEKFEKLSSEEKKKVLIHELLHIPKNFSGSLLPHRRRGRRVIDKRTIERLFKNLKCQNHILKLKSLRS